MIQLLHVVDYKQGILISAVIRLNDGLTIGRQECLIVTHATINNWEYRKKSGVLLSVTVGDGTRNLHNMWSCTSLVRAMRHGGAIDDMVLSWNGSVFACRRL